METYPVARIDRLTTKATKAMTRMKYPTSEADFKFKMITPSCTVAMGGLTDRS